GCGIQEHQINKIFERFYKGDQFTQGIGLGLPLCRLALSKIGASVEVSSAKDETGTVAVIKLPDSWINMG
ncbi:MAG: ATP-binding protein, partial [Bacteroidales bacterium]|nr:ATP-binding protein [Bacteroidales bacterium]